MTCGGALLRPTAAIILSLSTLASGPIDAQVFIWTGGTTKEMVMYIGGILGTILVIALIVFLVRRI